MVHFDLDALRSEAQHVLLERRRDLPGVLVGDESHGDLRRCAGREHGLRAVAREPAPDAVHIERRSEPESFECRKTCLSPEGR